MFDIRKIQQMSKDMQDKMSSMQDDMAKERVEGVAGGGVVKAVVTGNQELVDLVIDKEAVDPEDIDMLQDLVIAAVNQAIEKSKAMQQESMQKIMPPGLGGLGGLFQ